MSAPQTPAEALEQLRKEWKAASPAERHDIARAANAVTLIDCFLGSGAQGKGGAADE